MAAEPKLSSHFETKPPSKRAQSLRRALDGSTPRGRPFQYSQEEFLADVFGPTAVPKKPTPKEDTTAAAPKSPSKAAGAAKAEKKPAPEVELTEEEKEEQAKMKKFAEDLVPQLISQQLQRQAQSERQAKRELRQMGLGPQAQVGKALVPGAKLDEKRAALEKARKELARAQKELEQEQPKATPQQPPRPKPKGPPPAAGPGRAPPYTEADVTKRVQAALELETKAREIKRIAQDEVAKLEHASKANAPHPGRRVAEAEVPTVWHLAHPRDLSSGHRCQRATP